MRAAPLLAAAVLFLCGAIVLVGGRIVSQPAATVTPASDPPAVAAEPGPVAVAPALQHRPPAASRLVAPKIVAPPELDPDELEREPPRRPLSELSLALPPPPKISAEWAGTALYRPVATESAVFESKGRRIAIAGTQSVALDETCLADGVAWRCGVRARTAFRLWLRGRAPICALPDETDGDVIVARCRLGKQDAGAWLVSNGWARAQPGGPYAKAGDAARTAKIGIFGPPPDSSGLAAFPAPAAGAPSADQPVLLE